MAVRPGFWAFPKGQPQGAVPTIGEAEFETSKSVIPDRAEYNYFCQRVLGIVPDSQLNASLRRFVDVAVGFSRFIERDDGMNQTLHRQPPLPQQRKRFLMDALGIPQRMVTQRLTHIATGDNREPIAVPFPFKT